MSVLEKKLGIKEIVVYSLIGIAILWWVAHSSEVRNDKKDQSAAEEKVQQQKQDAEIAAADAKYKADADAEVAKQKAEDEAKRKDPKTIKFLKHIRGDIEAYVNGSNYGELYQGAMIGAPSFKSFNLDASYQAVTVEINYDNINAADALGKYEASKILRFVIKDALKYGVKPQDGGISLSVIVNSKLKGETTEKESSLGAASYNAATDSKEWQSGAELVQDGIQQFKEQNHTNLW